jgi:hypothetical protein
MRWWLVVSLLRRTLLVAVQLAPSAAMAAWASLAIVAVFFFAHRWIRPLQSPVGNLVQEISFGSLLVIAASAGFVEFGRGSASLQPELRALQYWIAALALATVLTILLLMAWSSRRAAAGVLVKVQDLLRRCRRTGRGEERMPMLKQPPDELKGPADWSVNDADLDAGSV